MTKSDVLHVTPADLRDTVRVTIDRELIATIDENRGGVSRSEYVEMVLAAGLVREYPHLPDDWTPESAADRKFERLVRFRETGR